MFELRSCCLCIVPCFPIHKGQGQGLPVCSLCRGRDGLVTAPARYFSLNNEPRTVASSFWLPFALVDPAPESFRSCHGTAYSCHSRLRQLPTTQARPIPPVKNAKHKIQLDCNKYSPQLVRCRHGVGNILSSGSAKAAPAVASVVCRPAQPAARVWSLVRYQIVQIHEQSCCLLRSAAVSQGMSSAHCTPM